MYYQLNFLSPILYNTFALFRSVCVLKISNVAFKGLQFSHMLEDNIEKVITNKVLT